MCRRGTVWHWTGQHTETFNQAKGTAKQSLALRTPDTSKPAELTVHVTPRSSGWCLWQQIEGHKTPLDFDHIYGRSWKKVTASWKNNCVPLMLSFLPQNPLPKKPPSTGDNKMAGESPNRGNWLLAITQIKACRPKDNVSGCDTLGVTQEDV